MRLEPPSTLGIAFGIAQRTVITYVDVATARAASGARLVVSGAFPSPWSEAAKGLFHVR